MTISAEFLVRGILPFVGREAELQELLEFWRGTLQSLELRAALMTGEAGIGKSRLIEELLPLIEREGGVVIHTRLFPESTTVITPLIARALHVGDVSRRLLRHSPEENITSVASALRRLARLRPTLLIVEDLHLLAGDALRDFTTLLNAIAEEPISILCSARPVELPGRAVLIRYLSREIVLAPLNAREIVALWQGIFGADIAGELCGQLQQITLGNPLALRSALRGVVKTQGIDRGDKGIAIHPTEELTWGLRQNVELLSEGMVGHLDAAQKNAAIRLACLGEVFARETVQAILPEAEEWVEELIAEGLLATTTTTAAPLAGYWGEIPRKHYPASQRPLLGFTHTMLHRHLAAQKDTDTCDRVVSAIADNLPLYSVHPFQILAERASALKAEPHTVLQGVQRICEIAAELNRSPDWKLGHQVWDHGWKLFESYRGRWTPEQARLAEVTLVNTQLTLMVREMHTERAGEVASRLTMLLQEPLPVDLAHFCIVALGQQLIITFQKTRSHDQDNWKSVEELVQRYPSLLFTRKYIDYLRLTAMTGALEGVRTVNAMVEQRYNEIIERKDCPDETREWLLKAVAPQFIPFFDSPETMRERMALLDQLNQVADANDNNVRIWRILFYYSIGEVDKALAACNEALPRFIDLGLRSNRFQTLLYKYSLLVSRGLGLEELLTQSNAFFTGTTGSQRDKMREETGKQFVELGIACNDLEWTERVIAEFLPEALPWNEERIILAAASSNPCETLQQIIDDDDTDDLDPAIVALYALIRNDDDADVIAIQQIVDRSLRAEIFKRRHPLVKRAIIELIQIVGADPSRRMFAAALRRTIHDAVSMSLEWYAERRMFPFMKPLPELYGEYLSRRERVMWRSRIEAIEQALMVQTSRAAGDARLRVSMLGSITIQGADEEPRTVSGARQRTLLGLLVADRMLDTSLDQREFRRLATGSEDDSESKRKIMNMAVFRLREAIGEDSVLTDEETPRLNTEYVHVDLLEAVEQLRIARTALRDRAILRAWPAVVRTLDLSRGEVAFPTLYDDFFEAMREDFESEVRTLAVDVARAVLNEGDTVAAEQILRRAFEAMPEDVEISELLCTALESSGKRAAAERVRMQMAGGEKIS